MRRELCTRLLISTTVYWPRQALRKTDDHQATIALCFLFKAQRLQNDKHKGQRAELLGAILSCRSCIRKSWTAQLVVISYTHNAPRQNLLGPKVEVEKILKQVYVGGKRDRAVCILAIHTYKN